MYALSSTAGPRPCPAPSMVPSSILCDSHRVRNPERPKMLPLPASRINRHATISRSGSSLAVSCSSAAYFILRIVYPINQHLIHSHTYPFAMKLSLGIAALSLLASASVSSVAISLRGANATVQSWDHGTSFHESYRIQVLTKCLGLAFLLRYGRDEMLPGGAAFGYNC